MTAALGFLPRNLRWAGGIQTETWQRAIYVVMAKYSIFVVLLAMISVVRHIEVHF